MKQACFHPDELDHLCDASADDSRLAHANECARCRTLVMAYRNFRESDALVYEGADPNDADARLSAWRAEAIGADRARAEPWLQRLFQPVIARPAFAAAAVVLVVIAGSALLFQPGLDRSSESPLRGKSDSRDVLALEPATIDANGQWNLRWVAAPDADSYMIHLYSDGLEPLAELGPVEAPAYQASATDMGLELPSGATVFWRVSALRGGDVIAESAASSVRIP